MLGVGILDIAANVLFAAALTFGLTGMVAVLGSMYPSPPCCSRVWSCTTGSRGGRSSASAARCSASRS